MKRRPFIAALLTLPLIKSAFASSLTDTTELPAFMAGEKLTYSLGWQFIVAGRATTEVLPDEDRDGKKVRNFRMKAKTRSSIDHIYKVRDELTATASYNVSRSHDFQKLQHEGKSHRNETIEFDWDTCEAHYHELLKDKKRTIPVPPNALDPLSAFYFVRNQPLTVGAVIQGPLTDGKRCRMAEIRVVKREKIKVNGTRYDTFKLAPNIKDVGGVFKKSKNANIEIWCTADHRHIPVLMKSKVAVGSFRAELERIESIAPSQPPA
jgi:hypothetical protein